MKAVVIHGAGDLRIEDVPDEPLEPDCVAVNVAAGGVCGSDLHYYLHGGFGPVRLKQPLVLGHEISGVVAAVGPDAGTVREGLRVAVDPSRPCRECERCRAADYRHCVNMRFLGSALRFPHVGGGFRETIIVHHSQVIPLEDDVSFGAAAMAEPLAVCLHAARQAGSLLNRKVLVTGCGPIGVLCILVAKLAGAREVLAVDINANALRWGHEAGADEVIDVGAYPTALVDHVDSAGKVDVVLEATGSEVAIGDAIAALQPLGTLVQIGLGGDAKLPLSMLVGKEIALRGSFRFDVEFHEAVDLINCGALSLDRFVSRTLPFTEATEAFDLGADRDRSMKVQMTFMEA